ncbi:flagellar basal body L-ring protein FlgH [Oceaniradius stylonematis]|uniref:flagellar basal body L-ring protein FlgH n=1 Tax=Oceaniradius stylonematis TaxID=2184161 RepID=UPI0027400AD9|nr:flagellar basal body L-ring protein FlgH [Oceaniradius stylonematis]
MTMARTRLRLFVAMAAVFLVAGCSATKDLGSPPALSPVGSGIDNQLPPSMIESKYPGRPLNKYSTWDDRTASLFTARKALTRGDTLTVLIDIADRAQLQSDSERSRSSSRSWNLGASGNWNGTSGAASGDANFGGDTDFSGEGATSRSERIDLRVAATVVDVLQNGHLVIRGTQEVRVNAEVRILTVAGIVRPSDIDPSNTIAYDRVSEARISYGGTGHISEVQQPAYGQQFIDRISPF